MAGETQQQSQQQQAGGESQDGSQQQSSQQQAQPQQTQQTQVQELPKELADLGFKSVKEVLGYMAEAGDDARRSKLMYRELTERISGSQPQQEDITDEAFIQSPKEATEKVVRKVHKQFEERVAPFLTQMVEGNVSMQKMVLRQDPVYGAVMPDLESELDDYLKTIPSELKVRSNAVKTALEYVIGRNFPKVAKKYNEATARVGTATEGGSSSSGSQTGASVKQAQMSDEERSAAEKQIRAGVFKDLDEYVKWRDS